MKPVSAATFDALAVVTFDDGHVLVFEDDNPPSLVTAEGEVMTYEDGMIPEVDDLLSHPTALYELPSSEMEEEEADDVRQKFLA